MIITPPPSIAHCAAQSFLCRMLGAPQSLEEISSFTSRALKALPLSDRAACVLFIAFRLSSVTLSDLEVAIQAKPSVIYASLRGLSDLGLISVDRDDDWTRTVTLTGLGKQFVSQVAGPRLPTNSQKNT